jgi:hypothetical protein
MKGTTATIITRIPQLRRRPQQQLQQHGWRTVKQKHWSGPFQVKCTVNDVLTDTVSSPVKEPLQQQQQHFLSSRLSRRFLMVVNPNFVPKSNNRTRFFCSQSSNSQINMLRCHGLLPMAVPSFLSTSSTSSSKRIFSTDDTNYKYDSKNHPPSQPDGNGDVVVFYQAPMAQLISRLKLISITTCIMSVTVLPVLIAIKHFDVIVVGTSSTSTTTTSTLSQQMSMGLVAVLGASGSTLALDFVFGPYVLEMAWIYPPIQNKMNNEDEKTIDKDPMDASAILLQFTTRSIFGWKNSYLVNPTIDGVIAPYSGGVRPFANLLLFVNSTGGSSIPLYVHSELLDVTTRRLLLLSNHEEKGGDENSTTVATTTTSSSSPSSSPLLHHHVDREGLPKSNNKKKVNNKKEDDDFW